MTLTIEDRLEINDLYSRYAYAFDGGDSETWAGLFTPDGVFAREGDPDLVGTEALREFAARRAEVSPGVKHLTLNVLVEESGDGAAGRAYVLALRVHPPDVVFALRTFGSYDDELVHGPDGWRFARRAYRFWVPAELSGSPFILAAPLEA